MSSFSRAPIRFYSKLHHRKVPLFTPEDIVQYSFIVQNSLSHLDLELSQSFKLQQACSMEEADNFPVKGVINTEEKCRKVLSESRRLLYTLHLDLPKKRECELKSSPQTDNLWLDPRFPHIGQIYIENYFYGKTLIEMLEYACLFADDKLKILNWFIAFEAFKAPYFSRLPQNVIKHFVRCMQYGSDNSEFMLECFKKLDFTNWMYESTEPGIVETILYQIHLSGRKMGFILWSYKFMEHCLMHPLFLYIGEVLKFKDAPNFDDALHTKLRREIEHAGMILSNLQTAVSSRNRRRRTLLLHLYWMYSQKTHRSSAAASEAVRFIWYSIPDVFFSLKEIGAMCKGVFRDDEIDEMYDFYSTAVGKFNSFDEPRLLQHYCRTIVRKGIWRKKQWIPEAINNSGLPLKLKPYLLLEK